MARGPANRCRRGWPSALPMAVPPGEPDRPSRARWRRHAPGAGPWAEGGPCERAKARLGSRPARRSCPGRRGRPPLSDGADEMPHRRLPGPDGGDAGRNTDRQAASAAIGRLPGALPVPHRWSNRRCRGRGRRPAAPMTWASAPPDRGFLEARRAVRAGPWGMWSLALARPRRAKAAIWSGMSRRPDRVRPRPRFRRGGRQPGASPAY